ncbi:short-chain dehydrogenase/reductase [Pseudomonas fluorescens]|uniref:Short-chain dehydrogenase/reductase n=1 Tax=Pseudomonas fluorescens TaxID=294 RepID=A0A1T2Y2I4_PSEFL|nr:SDR family NAD(P)-dependent oxidoreductase [Pseudomonas fluorescens]OPA86279.1 short-chain dehydrogenase/reductase [Pseudomonas fluorescens]
MSKVWLITGSASGIGKGIAQAALAAGDRVVATDLDLARLDDIFGACGDRVLTVQLDIRDQAQAHAAMSACMARFGRLDVLVNNAGYGQFGPFEEVDADAAQCQFATNVLGTFNVTRAALPTLRAQRGGHILNMSSNGGFKGVAGASLYSASKFAIEGFSESLAEEIADFGIRLTVVEPGAFRTDFLDQRVLKLGSGTLCDYDDYRAAALAVFAARNHQQPGDPARLGNALVRLVNEKHPPLRFIAGADAIKVVNDKLAAVAEETAQWLELSLSTDFLTDEEHQKP